MNRQERRNHSAAYQVRLRVFENKHAKHIYKTIEDQYLQVLSIAKSHGFQYALNQLEHYIIDGNLTGNLIALYSDVGPYMIKYYLLQIQSQTRKSKSLEHQVKDGRLGINRTWIQQILDYFSRNLLRRAVLRITQTNRREIAAVLRQGVQEGWGYDTMAENINSLPTRWQALRIARTESGNATAAAAILAVQNTPFQLNKQWVSAHDDRVRESHAEVDGTTIDQNALFDVNGNDCVGPHDPDLPAEEVVNCRCVLAFIPKRDKTGRLIPK